jgi:hypothetical protein
MLIINETESHRISELEFQMLASKYNSLVDNSFTDNFNNTSNFVNYTVTENIKLVQLLCSLPEMQVNGSPSSEKINAALVFPLFCFSNC